MAARASKVPRALSTSTPPERAPKEMRLTGLDSSAGRPPASLASSAPETLAAQDVAVALGRPREVDRRNFGQILAAAERAEHEFDHRAPGAEILGQRLRARQIVLARRIRDRGVGTHQAGKILLHLAFARIATADAHALAGGSRIDVEAGLGSGAWPPD